MAKIVPFSVKRRIVSVVPAWLWKKPFNSRFDGNVKDHESAIRADTGESTKVIDLKKTPDPMDHYVPDSAI